LKSCKSFSSTLICPFHRFEFIRNAPVDSMQQAVLHHFPDAQSTFKFTHRDAGVYFNRQCYEQFVAVIPRAYARSCSYSVPMDTLDARIRHLVADARGAHLAANRMPVPQTCVPRLPLRLPLQTLPGPGVFRAARTDQRRGPHRDRSVRSMGGSDLLGGAPNGHPE